MSRATTFAIGAAAAVVLAAAVISSSRATAPRADEDDGSGRIDISAAEPAPSPPQCILCMKPVEFVINFDDVTPPALPEGFIATNVQGRPPLWVTSDSGVPMPPADTPPNAVFIDDPAVVSDKLLDLPGLIVFEALDPQLTFRQNFNLEASEQDPNLGFDGGVLEISVDQGQTYHDILDAGGSFVTGGYNRTISTVEAARLLVVGRGVVIPAASLRLPFAYPTLLLRACCAGEWLVITVVPATAGALTHSILAGARDLRALRHRRRRLLRQLRQ